MAHQPDLADLPPAQRLALSYSSAATRSAWFALLALDSRLAGLVGRAREPMIAQLKLAWWRDQLDRPDLAAGHPEPLLVAMRKAALETARLVCLVDGWEAALCAPDNAAQAAHGLALARAEAVTGLLGARGSQEAIWLACLNWTHAEIGPAADAAAKTEPVSLPRELRPLQILGGLGARVRAAGRHELLASPLDMLVAMRIGLIGR